MSQPTKLDLPPVDPLPERTAKYFRVCEEKLGMVPNVLRAHAFEPAKLDAFTGLYNELMLAESGLTKLEREMIAVCVSSANRCYYCLVAHGAAVREMGGAELGERMALNWRTADLEPRHVAMLEFSEALTLHSHRTSEADRERLRGAGFTDRDIWDIANVAGFFNMTNRVASATGMEPNPEYHGVARQVIA